MTRFAELVDEASAGSVEVQIFPAAQLFSEVDLIDALPSGTTDMGLINIAQWSGTVPTSQVLDIPFLFPDIEAVHTAFDGEFGEQLKRNFRQSDVHLAGWVDYEFLQLASNEQIQTPDDLSGRNIRTASALVAQAIQSAGGSSVTMSGSEAYTALERGTVNGALSGFTSFDDRAYYEVTDQVLELNIVWNMFAIGMNAGVWESLTPEQQDAINSAAQEMQDWQREQQAAAVDESRQIIQEEGMEIYTPSEDEMQQWRQAMVEPVREEFLNLTGEPGAELLDTLN